MRFTSVCLFAVLSSFTVGCIDDVDESSTDQELSIDEDIVVPEESFTDNAELARNAIGNGSLDQVFTTSAESQRYCVDQSYASADRVSCFPFMCPANPNWETQLSRNHAVHIIANCGGTYVDVASHWNAGSCYRVRRDALRPC